MRSGCGADSCWPDFSDLGKARGKSGAPWLGGEPQNSVCRDVWMFCWSHVCGRVLGRGQESRRLHEMLSPSGGIEAADNVSSGRCGGDGSRGVGFVAKWQDGVGRPLVFGRGRVRTAARWGFLTPWFGPAFFRGGVSSGAQVFSGLGGGVRLPVPSWLADPARAAMEASEGEAEGFVRLTGGRGGIRVSRHTRP